VSVNGVTAAPSRLIATAYWQGMRIQTRTAAPTRLYAPNGSGVEKVDSLAGSSIYLMVMLSDRYTSEAVTYAPVYATIKNAAGMAVYHGRMKPTISAFEGPHHGNNVKLPGARQYTIMLRIDPPHQTRHLEYEHVWLQPHTVVKHFTWDGNR
jgi:Fe2+ transport protein